MNDYDAILLAEWLTWTPERKKLWSIGCKTEYDWTSSNGSKYHVYIW